MFRTKRIIIEIIHKKSNASGLIILKNKKGFFCGKIDIENIASCYTEI